MFGFKIEKYKNTGLNTLAFQRSSFVELLMVGMEHKERKKRKDFAHVQSLITLKVNNMLHTVGLMFVQF